MTLFLHYYDGYYKSEIFETLEVVNGTPYYKGEPCKVGEKFEVPVRDPFVNGKIISKVTELQYDEVCEVWVFKDFEKYVIQTMLCRKYEK